MQGGNMIRPKMYTLAIKREAIERKNPGLCEKIIQERGSWEMNDTYDDDFITFLIGMNIYDALYMYEKYAKEYGVTIYKKNGRKNPQYWTAVDGAIIDGPFLPIGISPWIRKNCDSMGPYFYMKKN